MVHREFATFEEFWPHYLAQHLHPGNRALHFVGTSTVYVILGLSVTLSPTWLIFAPFAAYGFCWMGHLFLEAGHPASASHRLWSLRGDFRLHWRMLTGCLKPELVRICRKSPGTPSRGGRLASSF